MLVFFLFIVTQANNMPITWAYSKVQLKIIAFNTSQWLTIPTSLPVNLLMFWDLKQMF